MIRPCPRCRFGLAVGVVTCDTFGMDKPADTLPGANAPKPSRSRRFVPVASQAPVILEAAGELFLQRGYDSVSMDAITKVVGGSKRDIYALFGDKETLFRQAVEKLATERSDHFRDLPPCGDVAAALTAVGRKYVEVLLSPRALALHRLILSEAARAPNAVEAFLTNAPERAYATVADLLRHHAARGEVVVSAPEVSARIFVGALAADLQLRALLGHVASPEVQHAKVAAAVQHFLSGVARA